MNSPDPDTHTLPAARESGSPVSPVQPYEYPLPQHMEDFVRPIVLREADDWREEIRLCAYGPCERTFRPKRRHHAFHSSGCRDLHKRKRERAELVAIRGELGEANVLQWLSTADEATLRRVVRKVCRALEGAGKYHGEHKRFRVRF